MTIQTELPLITRESEHATIAHELTNPQDNLNKEKLAIQEVELNYTNRITVKNWRIENSKIAHTMLKTIFDPLKLSVREEFVVLFLNQSNHVTGYYQGFQGGITAVWVDPRIIFSIALKTLSVAIIVAHNHPSGNLFPSERDKELTKKLTEAGQILDIKVIDHLIITADNAYYSFADMGLM
jgi:DNA repair protein RadC